ncbi:MAG: Panacea domain-containing protein [Tumebacillaceae bacterium]
MATIFDVANYFRARIDYEAGDNITPLKLQKLCYYAQAWHATWNQGERLFEEDFEHWDHGPANHALFNKYRDYKWQPIDPSDLSEYDPAETFTLQQLESLAEVWDAYGDYSAKRLENLTHQEDPWLNTAPNETITVEAMVEYYAQLTED